MVFMIFELRYCDFIIHRNIKYTLLIRQDFYYGLKLSHHHMQRPNQPLLTHNFQSEFCKALEGEESSGTKFTVDRWRRHNPSEGGGITCVMQDGETFEKAGVNITVMSAPLSKQLQASMRARSVRLGGSFAL